MGKTVDILLGPEMRSTGEVMGFDRDFPHAFAKSQLAAYDGGLPTHGNVFISVNDTDKRQLPLIAVRLEELGFKLWATEGTASVLRRYGIESNIVDKISTRVTPIRKPRSRCITLPDPWARTWFSSSRKARST